MNIYNLRKNQNIAIHKSIENNFKSGVHFHATYGEICYCSRINIKT